jgi:hypothetical protein
MRRAILITLAAAILAATGWTARAATTTQPTRLTPAAHRHTGQTAPATTDSLGLAAQLARARLATARYATSLHAARPTATRSPA